MLQKPLFSNFKMTVYCFLITLFLCSIFSCTSKKAIPQHNKNTPVSTIVNTLKSIQKSNTGKHLFGHESTITMGVSGVNDWNIIEENSKISTDIYANKADVLQMTGKLPAIIGYDAFKLILDVTDGAHRKPDVDASISALKLYRDNGGLIAFNWHMQPIGIPNYKERAYRMDEFNNNPHIALMTEIKPFYRIANGFEKKDKWWVDFERNRLAPMAERLKLISKDGSGIIMRPFHEADGAWFWWGLQWLQGDLPLNGKEALIKVFIETARYFKQELPNILIAFSTDKLNEVSHENISETEIIKRYQDAFNTYLPKNKLDLALIDIYGIDLYTSPENPLPSKEQFRLKLRALTQITNKHHKIAAITEAGNRGIPAEEDKRQPTINWYNNYLFSWIKDPEIQIAYTIIWQNWSNNRNPIENDPADGYFVPINPNSPPGIDFIKYIENKNTLMLDDFKLLIAKK